MAGKIPLATAYRFGPLSGATNDYIVDGGQSLVVHLSPGDWEMKVKISEPNFDVRFIEENGCNHGRLDLLRVKGPQRIFLDNSHSWFSHKNIRVGEYEELDEKMLPVKYQDRSAAFIRVVENFDAEDPKSESAESSVGTLPTDPKARKMALVRKHTSNAFYHTVNKCIRDDDETNMNKYAGYIFELREVFRTDDATVAEIFSGDVNRGITVSDPSEYLSSFRPGDELVWPQFTSTSCKKGCAGNVIFEISCGKFPGGDVLYGPKKFTDFLQYRSENEVIFPPHLRFRVVNIKGNILQLETIEFRSIWDAIAAKDWVFFKKWVEANPSRVDTKDCEYSMINKVAEQMLDQPIGDEVQPCESTDSSTDAIINPLEVCLQNYADINEVDKMTGNTPLIIAAKNFDKFSKQSAESSTEAMNKTRQTLELCLAAGADPFKETNAGIATTYCHEIQELQKKVKPRTFTRAPPDQLNAGQSWACPHRRAGAVQAGTADAPPNFLSAAQAWACPHRAPRSTGAAGGVRVR